MPRNMGVASVRPTASSGFSTKWPTMTHVERTTWISAQYLGPTRLANTLIPTSRPEMARFSLELTDQFLKTRVFTERIQVVVVFQPSLVPQSGTKSALEVFHCFFEFSSS